MHRGAYLARLGEHKAMRFKTQNQRRSAAMRGRDESSRAAARAQQKGQHDTSGNGAHTDAATAARREPSMR